MDQSNEVSSGSTDPNRDRAELKCCTICRTTKTPLWRGGPSGPKSLCNACGIRYRKERRDFLGLNDGVEKIKKETKKKLRNGGKMDMLGLLGFDAGVLLKQRSMLWLKRRRHLGEEEEAAVLLMALSSGFL